MSQVSYIQRLDTTGGLGPGQLTNTQPPPETTTRDNKLRGGRRRSSLP